MKGIFYGVGVGPGDPELMTLKAVRIIKENDIIAVPGIEPQKSTAYKIAVQAVPELSEKKLLPIKTPMTKDAQNLKNVHKESADIIEHYLLSGSNVVYITLGDPNLYSSYSYLRDILSDKGYKTEAVSGVTSLSACASKLGVSLAQGNEQLHIYTSFGKIDSNKGNIVIMKSGRTINDISEELKNKKIYAVENCGMENEHIYRDELPEKSGYFTSIFFKDKSDI